MFACFFAVESLSIDGSDSHVKARAAMPVGEPPSPSPGHSHLTVDDLVSRVADFSRTAGVLAGALDDTLDLAHKNMRRGPSSTAASMNNALEKALDEISAALALQREGLELLKHVVLEVHSQVMTTLRES
jgi:hypothetical protein